MKQKTKAYEVKRELSKQEITHIHTINCRVDEVSLIFDVEGGNWNLMKLRNDLFISVPKDGNTASPAYYGNERHTKKYYELIAIDK